MQTLMARAGRSASMCGRSPSRVQERIAARGRLTSTARTLCEMRTPWVLVALLAAAAGCHPPPRVLPESALPPGGVAGGHEEVLNGARQYYRVAGVPREGVPPVVFLHGGPGQGSEHFDVLEGPYLETVLRMVYYDQRGSGKSERPAGGDYKLGTLVEDVDALRRNLGVEKIAIIGHSFGGLLAIEYAKAHPEQVSHLVFVSGVWSM